LSAFSGLSAEGFQPIKTGIADVSPDLLQLSQANRRWVRDRAPVPATKADPG
jgi:hypothetical protein